MRTTQTAKRRPNGHDIHPTVDGDESTCPYCGAPLLGPEHLRQINSRIEAEERTRVTRLETALRQQFSRQQQQAIAKVTADAEKARKDAVKVAETKLKLLRSNLETTVAARLQAQRDMLNKQTAEAINAERVKAFEEKTRLTQQLADMQSRLEQRSAFAIGDPPEIDLFEALKREFPADRIARVGRGSAGADILHDVIDGRGVVAGRIVYDSKAHRRWQSRFVTKLREDVIAHKGDHGVLSTTAFPAAAGGRGLHITNGLIISTPERVPTLVHLLRRQVVVTQTLRLGNSARDETRDRLYAFVTSDQCRALLDQFVVLTDAFSDLEAREVKSHTQNWARRADLIRSVKTVHDEFADAISRIIGMTEPALEDGVEA